jgi:glycosyltransferase involved in cell wall biosynthesis
LLLIVTPGGLMCALPSVSVVVPAFNEAGRLTTSLPDLLDSLPADAELIVVDDGSSDETAQIAAHALRGVRWSTVIRLEHNLGKGAAVRRGVEQAQGETVIYMDADLATDPQDLPTLVGHLADCEIAIGSRAVAGAVVDCPKSIRIVMGRAFNGMVRLTSGLGLHDTQCGFKAFRSEIAKGLFRLSRLDGYAFDVEILLLARQLGLRIVEVPVRWRHVDGSHIRPLRDSAIMTAEVVRTRTLWRRNQRSASLSVDPSPGARGQTEASLDLSG